MTSSVERRFVTQTLELQEEKLRRSEAYLAEAQRLTHTGSWAWQVAGSEALRIYPRNGTEFLASIQKIARPPLANFCSVFIPRIAPEVERGNRPGNRSKVGLRSGIPESPFSRTPPPNTSTPSAILF